MAATKSDDNPVPSDHGALLAMLWKGICNAIRVRIMEVLIEEPTSPVRFRREHAPGVSLTVVSYNFRELAKHLQIRCVKEIPRRGSVEHIYEAVGRVSLSDAQWKEIPMDQRPAISATMMQGLIARFAGALVGGTFEARDDSHLVWIGARSNERGWERSVEILLTAFKELEANRVETERELDEAGEEGFRVTFGLLGFESPDPKRAQNVS